MAGIYIHIPFCQSKCYYCDFYSIKDKSLINNYIQALVREIELYSYIHDFKKYEINTIYFGGGTPSILDIRSLNKIINTLDGYFSLENCKETTIEANPNNIDRNYLKSLLELGFNRISIGVQSFVDKELLFLKRIHNAKSAMKAIEIANECFNNVSIDLIYGIPKQTKDSWFYSLNQTLQNQIQHISTYNLIYESNTPLSIDFEKGLITKTSDEEDEELYLMATDILVESGYVHYEISNFAKEKKQCLHNLLYWNGDEYFGFGPSSSGYLNNKRYTNKKNLNQYLNDIKENSLPIGFMENIDINKKIKENIMLSLRSSGIDIDKFKTYFEIDLLCGEYGFIEELERNGFLTISNNKIRLTTKGYFLSNAICLMFFSKIDKKNKTFKKKSINCKNVAV